MMKYLWLGMYTTQAIRDYLYNQYKFKSLSITVAQENIINGLSNYIQIDSINGGRMPVYNINGKLLTSQITWRNENGSSHTIVPMLNIKYLELLYKSRKLISCVEKWGKMYNADNKIVFIYGMHSPYLKAATYLKKNFPNVKLILIIPDLPEYYDLNMSKFKKVLKTIDYKSIYSCMDKIDGYVLFSKHMQDYLNIVDKPNIIIEGSIDPYYYKNLTPYINNNVIKIMYSGAINKNFGIEILLSAFEMMKDETIELWISGTGEFEKKIKEHATNDKRIKYFGFFPNRLDLVKMQQQATMLINTRLPNCEASRYCFPSKLLDYLATGRPVISFKIDGIPDEYYKYVIPVKNANANELMEAIRYVSNMSEKQRFQLGLSGRKFVLDEKNFIAQSKKIYDFSLSL